MNPGENDIPDSLSHWLEIATDGLAASGKERITREISAHYAAAVESHHSQGEPEAVAQANAVAELGDANEAAKRFRKSHFTDEEVKVLADVLKKAGKLSYLLLQLLIPMGFFIFLFFFIGPPKHSFYFRAGVAELITFPIVSFMICSRGSVRANVPRLMLVELMTDAASLLAIAFAAVAYSPDVWGGYFVIAAGLPRSAYRRLRLWNKARKILRGADKDAVSAGQLPA